MRVQKGHDSAPKLRLTKQRFLRKRLGLREPEEGGAECRQTYMSTGLQR